MGQIWITGSGIVSAIGIGKEETLDSLLAARSGIGALQYLRTEHHEFPVGEVKLTDEEMMHRMHIPEGTPMTRTALMGMMALQEALADAGLQPHHLPSVGFISGTTVGGMDKSEIYYLDFLENNERNDYIRTHDCGACTEMIADHFGQFAFTTTISTACSSAANAILLGANMIRTGEAECVVVGGSECITKFHLNGFNSLMILDHAPCKPFDSTRAGLNLGEGAAYLVLESDDHARRRGREAQAVLAGYGNACDSFHQTASSPNGEGAFRAMQAALQMAAIPPQKVDYINAHGTGTPNNDASESEAVRRIFGDRIPLISSTKSMTGHTTSASGSIEAVICLLAMKNDFVPANLNYRESDPACVQPVRETLTGRPLSYVLCNSFGFGGNDTSLLLAQPSHPHSFHDHGTAQPVYLCAAQQISIQGALNEEWMDAPLERSESYYRSLDPDFKAFIPPLEARRMGKILKRAIATSESALQAAGGNEVDAIITGTGLGCIENTEFFLDALCREGEQMLKPTYFMQSTHNTISSLVGIRKRCHGYNVTYAHKEISFDSALYDAFLQLRLGAIHSALVGGHDEMTPSYFNLLTKAGYLGNDSEVAGETAVSLVLSHHPAEGVTPLCRIAGMKMVYQPSEERLRQQLDDLLGEASLTLEEIDGVMVATNGDRRHDSVCMRQFRQLFGDRPVLHYKHLFGESYTASGLGLYAAACCLKQRRIPNSLYAEKVTPDTKPLKAILLYNTDGKSHSLLLLTC